MHPQIHYSPFQQLLYDFEIHLFTLKIIEGIKLLKKVQTFTDTPEGTETRCIKSRGVNTFEQDEDFSKFFLFCININIFPFSTALQKQQKILVCFPEDKLSTIYLDLQFTLNPPTHPGS